MMPLTVGQLLADKSTGKDSGTCPFCKGKIIKNICYKLQYT